VLPSPTGFRFHQRPVSQTGARALSRACYHADEVEDARHPIVGEVSSIQLDAGDRDPAARSSSE
jgi:hypothetical protein